MNKHLKRIVLSKCSVFIIHKLKYYQEFVELQVTSNQTLAVYKGVIHISQFVITALYSFLTKHEL